jgi:hypothetical protein
MAENGINVVSIDTTAGFFDLGGFYLRSMFTVGEIEPTGVWDMISKVIKKVGDQKIRTLAIHGHGFPGMQGVAYSRSLDREGNRTLTLDEKGNLAGQGQFMSCLGPYFMPRGRIHLGGCHAAAGEDGASLLRAISKAVSRTGSPVIAYGSESWQNPWWPGYETITGRVRWSDGKDVYYTSATSMD